MNSSKRLKSFKTTCMCWRRRAKCNLLKIIVKTWWRSLRRDQPSLAQSLKNIQWPTRTRFNKRARLRKSSPNIAWPSTRHKNHSPRSLEVPTSGECATSVERRVTLPAHAQVWRWAVTLTVTGQTGAFHRSDRCRPGLHPSSEQVKDDPLSKNKAQKQSWKRNCKEWCDQQEQKPHLLWMPSKGSHGKRLSKW
jgi:hypothetical protein